MCYGRAHAGDGVEGRTLRARGLGNGVQPLSPNEGAWTIRIGDIELIPGQAIAMPRSPPQRAEYRYETRQIHQALQ